MEIKNLAKNQIITSYNFARLSNVVYAESVTFEQYKQLKNENTKAIFKSGDQVLYINTRFRLQENDLIFCNSNFIESLFKELYKIENLKNLKIITNQTDRMIDEKLFNTKPKCISEWYSINVNFVHQALIPIPLGLSNDYSRKNILYDNYKNLSVNTDKQPLIYSNFQVNTNFFHRTKVINRLKFNPIVIFDDPNLEINKYIQNLIFYKYIVAPLGNGDDSHRIWETLYAGSVPIVFDSPTFTTLKTLPHIYIDDISQLKNASVINIKSYEKFNFDKLNIEWWIKKIKKNIIISSEMYNFDNSKEFNHIYNNYYKSMKRDSYKKRLKTLIRRILQKTNLNNIL